MSEHSILTLDQANQIITAALAAARSQNLPQMAVAVVDPAGHLVALQREDGARQMRVEIAIGKAYAAAGMGMASSLLNQRARDNPPFFNALSSSGKFIPQAGAVAIKRADGVVIGAVGASGALGEQDEDVCRAGVASAGLAAG